MNIEIIAEIRTWHRQRCFLMEQRKRSVLALGAFLRTMHGWSPVIADSEKKRILADVTAIMKEPEGTEWENIVLASHEAIKPFEKLEKNALKNMERLAKGLPIWAEFASNIRGFGAASLAVILAEAGDLGNYSNIGKLNKRMGLAVIDGIAQGKLPKGSPADSWIEHGYNPERRARVYCIGDTIIKGNRDGKYRMLYLSRKEFELSRDPEMTKMHAHRRAQRYMEKRLLKDLWQAWRRIKKPLPNMAKRSLSSAEIHEGSRMD